MTKVKVIANYLPQFHEIPENDRFWGKGYTDWVGVKKAKKLYKGHVQPKVPLHEHYYSLDDPKEIAWQAELAREHGVYGFGMYHYWFHSRLQLLQTPGELLHAHPEIDIHYFFIWDNVSWKRTWSALRAGNDWAPSFDKEKSAPADNGVLAPLDYGEEEDWKIHFEYLLPFFRDPRYIRVEGKPLFGIFNPSNDNPTLRRMFACWDALARENGLPGVQILSRYMDEEDRIGKSFLYEPFTDMDRLNRINGRLQSKYSRTFHRPQYRNYDIEWRKILRAARKNDPRFDYLGGFVSFDDTPRRGALARVIRGAAPEKFGRYMAELLTQSRRYGREFAFVTAWNEWGEGAYLEPDEEHGLGYLEALKKAVTDTGNFPE